MCNALQRDRLPDLRVVIRFDFTRGQRHERYWLLIEHGDAEICKEYPGLDEDLYVTAEAEAFVKWHAGRLAWAEPPATAASKCTVPRRSFAPFLRGTAAASSRTSSRRPVRQRSWQSNSRPRLLLFMVTN